MNSIDTNDILDEVWEAKDSLSADFGHDLAATCRSIYIEQAKHPEKFVNLGPSKNAQQAGAGQQATRREPNPE